MHDPELYQPTRADVDWLEQGRRGLSNCPRDAATFRAMALVINVWRDAGFTPAEVDGMCEQMREQFRAALVEGEA